MECPKGKLIVLVDLQQRSNYMVKYGSLELWMDSSFGEDGKQTNPTVAEVFKSGDDSFKEGELVLCHFNTFSAMVNDYYIYGDHVEKDDKGRSYFTIFPTQVRAKLDKEGMPFPVDGYILVKRILLEIKSTLIIPDIAQGHDMTWFKVDKVCEGVDFKEGDLVMCYSKSDMLIKYTFDKKQVECFVVKLNDINAYVKEKRTHHKRA